PIAGQPTPRRIASASPVSTPPRLAVSSPPPPVLRPAVPTPSPTPPVSLAMLNTPPPRPAVVPPVGPTPIQATSTPPPIASVPLTGTPSVSPSGVPLKPFITAAPAPGTLPPVAGATWRTYAPGQAPAARSITPAEATSLAGRGDLGEKLYLRGDFRVTASGENRAVLRDRPADADPANPAPGENVRIIVEYPAGALPPGENTSLSRDSGRPFEIRDIRRGADGQVNIYVREITAQ
ncbi:MAG TPA: hypothetical protein VF593_02540, partial [Chthoniobacteraceae bacterium]